jgi:hypothetical protein
VFGCRIATIDFRLATHCCPWPISGRATGLPWNLTFADTAEQPGDGDSGHSRVATIVRQEIPAERLHPKIAYSRCR